MIKNWIIAMDVFSLEDDDCADMFITQTPSASIAITDEIDQSSRESIQIFLTLRTSTYHVSQLPNKKIR